jgi:hypothetical protein
MSPPGRPAVATRGMPCMDRPDQAEDESIRRFRHFEAMWRMVAEAVREAEARRRLEIALEVLARRPAGSRTA